MPIGVIPIDSIFSPVTRVNYAVEATRVGQRTDYDKLILEIWTDGRITPEDALASVLGHSCAITSIRSSTTTRTPLSSTRRRRKSARKTPL